ncbi:hypothetical protein GF312_04340 [Candidatus Poribacteria bacterium]|nr:hypothetical protein [Candidatus Poribacteria bacterium]
MCGIIYYKNFTGRPVNRLALKHYFRQKHRGHEGFGFMGISGKRLMTCRATHESGIKQYLKRHSFSEILFHHRYPTSTSNTIKTTHPIAVSQPLYNHKYYVIHNGMIYNAHELKAKHEKMKINYRTSQYRRCRNYWGEIEEDYEFNDSEALAHEIALFLDGRQENIEAKGDMAFICLETDRNNNALKLHFARNNGSPLEMKNNSHLLVIASESLSNQDIPAHTLHTYDYRTGEISHSRIEFPEYSLVGSSSLYSFWDQLDEIEMSIQEYEEELNRIENAQLRASVSGNTMRYQRLQRKKDQLEEQIGQLYDERDYMQSIRFDW